jgi:signal transduction histidine kinase
MTLPLRILHLEDDPLDSELVKSALEDEDVACDICRVDTRNDFIAAVADGEFDIILSDYSLPNFDGLSALAIVSERRLNIPFIFVTGKMGEELAIETLKKGATDYILKTSIARLVPSMQRALREAKERSERRKAVEELRKSHDQIRYLAAHLQSTREEERTYIAREIHDELGQIMTAIKMDVALMKKRYSDHEGIFEKTSATLNLIDASIKSIKKICTELRPAMLDHLGLGAAIEWQAQEFQKRSGIECEVTLNPDVVTIARDQSTALFRIFQEALTNVHRHSKATKVRVTLSEREDSVILEIADNGIGLTEKQFSKANSFGLLGMRERVHILNGQLQISGSQNRGTIITVLIPRDNCNP